MKKIYFALLLSSLVASAMEFPYNQAPYYPQNVNTNGNLVGNYQNSQPYEYSYNPFNPAPVPLPNSNPYYGNGSQNLNGNPNNPFNPAPVPPPNNSNPFYGNGSQNLNGNPNNPFNPAPVPPPNYNPFYGNGSQNLNGNPNNPFNPAPVPPSSAYGQQNFRPYQNDPFNANQNIQYYENSVQNFGENQNNPFGNYQNSQPHKNSNKSFAKNPQSNPSYWEVEQSYECYKKYKEVDNYFHRKTRFTKFLKSNSYNKPYLFYPFSDGHFYEMQEKFGAMGYEVGSITQKTVTQITFVQSLDEGNEHLDGLYEIFHEHKVPLGMIQKLTMLKNFDMLEFIVDDSGSMTRSSGVDQNGRPQTRWQEAKERLLLMMKILAHVEKPTIIIRFLNRSDVIEISPQNDFSPKNFFKLAKGKITRVFKKAPSGRTPAYERLLESFNRGKNKNIARYFFCDGKPNGEYGTRKSYEEFIDDIKRLVMARHNPEGNPMTFISCSDRDRDVEWMKEVEEVALFCAEYDDYNSEEIEVSKDQGAAFPFSYGLYIVANLVGAISPYDLDALDECIPLTKSILQELIGTYLGDEDYRYYFDQFLLAQKNRPVKSIMDRVKKNFPWKDYFQDFLEFNSFQIYEIPVVKEYKSQLKKSLSLSRRN